jgi:hypothetical protein
LPLLNISTIEFLESGDINDKGIFSGGTIMGDCHFLVLVLKVEAVKRLYPLKNHHQHFVSNNG